MRSTGSGALPPGLPPAFPRARFGRGNGLGEPLGRRACVGSHAGQEVLVGLHREGDVGVAEPFADHLDVDPVLDEQAPMRVAQIMEPDGGDAGVRNDPPERFVDGVWVDGSAVACGEDPLLGVLDADRSELAGLMSTPPGEYRQRGVVELDRRAVLVLPRVSWTS